MTSSLKNAFILPFLIIFSTFPIFIQAEEQRPYTIGIVPQFEIRHIRKIWNPILNEVYKNTDIKIKLIGSPTIPQFEKEFNQGKFDFVYMNPYHMLLANNSQGYTPLVRDIGRQLHGILVVRKDSGINSISDLEGKNIAFPAPNALGASLLMRASLHNEHKLNFHPIYVKTHSSVYLNVIVKQTTAGGGVMKTLNQQRENIKAALKILYRTPKVAPHPIAVHPRVPEEIRKKIQASFLLLGQSTIGKSLLAKIPMKKIGLAKMSDYTPLKKFNLESFHVQ